MNPFFSKGHQPEVCYFNDPHHLYKVHRKQIKFEPKTFKSLLSVLTFNFNCSFMILNSDDHKGIRTAFFNLNYAFMTDCECVMRVLNLKFKSTILLSIQL